MDYQAKPRIVFPPESSLLAKKEVQVSGGFHLLTSWENHRNVAEVQTKEKDFFGSTTKGERGNPICEYEAGRIDSTV